MTTKVSSRFPLGLLTTLVLVAGLSACKLQIISSIGGQISECDSSVCEVTINKGDIYAISATAIPALGYRFAYWDGAAGLLCGEETYCNASVAPDLVNLDLTGQLIAHFEPDSQPLSWSAFSGVIPAGALVVGGESDEEYYICRGEMNGGVYPGKYRAAFDGCRVSHLGGESILFSFEILEGDPRRVAWADNQVPSDALVTGASATEQPLYSCRALYNGEWHPGNTTVSASGCEIALAGEGLMAGSYQVLRSGAWIPAADGTNFDNGRPAGNKGGDTVEFTDIFVCRSTEPTNTLVGRYAADESVCYVADDSEFFVLDFEVLSDWDTLWTSHNVTSGAVNTALKQRSKDPDALISALGDDLALFTGGVVSDADWQRAIGIAAMRSIGAVVVGTDDEGFPLYSCRAHVSDTWLPGKLDPREYRSCQISGGFGSDSKLELQVFNVLSHN